MAETETTPVATPRQESNVIPIDPKIVESIVLRGDISGLSPAQKVAYANGLAVRVGLDPSTAPFKSIQFKRNGEFKEIMYADKGTAEQLRKLHDVTITIVAREEIEGVFFVTARARLPNGREDEDVGAVSVGNYGDARANAIMKAHTKAKRRVTLSILGLGVLDESEIETVQQDDRFANVPKEEAPASPQAAPAPVVQMPKPEVVPAKAATKEPHPQERPPVQEEPQREPEQPKPIKPSEDTIPPMLLKTLEPLAAFKDVPLGMMTDDDLELVLDVASRAYTQWRSNPKTDKKVLKVLQDLAARANGLLNHGKAG